MNIKKRSLSLLLAFSMVFSMFGILRNVDVYAGAGTSNYVLELNFNDLNDDGTFTINLDCTNNESTDLASGTFGVPLKFTDLSKVGPNPQSIACVTTTASNGNCSDASKWNDGQNTNGLDAAYYSSGDGITVGAGETVTILSIACKINDVNINYNQTGLSQYLKLEDEGNNGVTGEAKGAIGEDTYNVTINWPKEKFTVTFDTQGGSTVDSVKVEEGTSVGSNMPTDPTREGYVFKEWQYNNGSTDVKFESTTTINADTTVNAKWAPLLTVDLGYEGATNPTPVEITNGSTISTLKVNDPTRDYYKFTGWKDNENNTVIASTTFNATEPVTITAQWEECKYKLRCNCTNCTIRNHLDGKVLTVTQPVTMPTEQEMALAGYKFEGWLIGSTALTLVNNVLDLTNLASAMTSAGQTLTQNDDQQISLNPSYKPRTGTITLYLGDSDGKNVIFTKHGNDIECKTTDGFNVDYDTTIDTATNTAFAKTSATREGYSQDTDDEGKVYLLDSDLKIAAGPITISDIQKLLDFYKEEYGYEDDGDVLRIATVWSEDADAKANRLNSELVAGAANMDKDTFAAKFKELNAAIDAAQKADGTYAAPDLRKEFEDQIKEYQKSVDGTIIVRDGLKWSAVVTITNLLEQIGALEEQIPQGMEFISLFDFEAEDLCGTKEYKEKENGMLEVSMPIPAEYRERTGELKFVHVKGGEADIIDAKDVEIQDDGTVIVKVDSFSSIGIIAPKDKEDEKPAAGTDAGKDDKSSKSKKTGDQANLAFVLAMFMSSTLLLGYALLSLKKNKGSKENI